MHRRGRVWIKYPSDASVDDGVTTARISGLSSKDSKLTQKGQVQHMGFHSFELTRFLPVSRVENHRSAAASSWLSLRVPLFPPRLLPQVLKMAAGEDEDLSKPWHALCHMLCSSGYSCLWKCTGAWVSAWGKQGGYRMMIRGSGHIYSVSPSHRASSLVSAKEISRPKSDRLSDFVRPHGSRIPKVLLGMEQALQTFWRSRFCEYSGMLQCLGQGRPEPRKTAAQHTLDFQV